MRHVISALVMNEPGVLANVAEMFAARGFNIDSLAVGPRLGVEVVYIDRQRLRTKGPEDNRIGHRSAWRQAI